MPKLACRGPTAGSRPLHPHDMVGRPCHNRDRARATRAATQRGALRDRQYQNCLDELPFRFRGRRDASPSRHRSRISSLPRRYPVTTSPSNNFGREARIRGNPGHIGPKSRRCFEMNNVREKALSRASGPDLSRERGDGLKVGCLWQSAAPSGEQLDGRSVPAPRYDERRTYATRERPSWASSRVAFRPFVFRGPAYFSLPPATRRVYRCAVVSRTLHPRATGFT